MQQLHVGQQQLASQTLGQLRCPTDELALHSDWVRKVFLHLFKTPQGQFCNKPSVFQYEQIL